MTQMYKLYLFQSGKYEEPYWLSNNSKMLIKSMLQIDPVKRITIHELCRHPWITGNSLKSVSFIHRTEVRIFIAEKLTFCILDILYEILFFHVNIQFEKDNEVLNTMSAICGGNSTDIWKKLVQSDRTDYRTATYLLLLDRKLRGLSLKIAPITRSHLKQEMVKK